jgi:hypothetical protein
VSQAGPELANIYLHARYYDSVLGVFLSPDPAGTDRNTYRYSFGDSVNFSDPSGLVPTACWSYFSEGGGNGTPLVFRTEVRCTQIGTPTFLQNHDEATEGLEDEFFRKKAERRTYLDEIRENWRTRFGTGSDNRDCGGKPCKGPDGGNGGNGNGNGNGSEGGKKEAAVEQKADPAQDIRKPLPPCDSGNRYGDVNVTVIGPSGVGFSVGHQGSGIQVDHRTSPSHLYGGLALGAPGVSITSQQTLLGSISPGLNVALSYQTGALFGAIGRQGASRFWEVGGGVGSPGGNISFTWVSQNLGLATGRTCQ